LLKYVVGQ